MNFRSILIAVAIGALAVSGVSQTKKLAKGAMKPAAMKSHKTTKMAKKTPVKAGKMAKVKVVKKTK